MSLHRYTSPFGPTPSCDDTRTGIPSPTALILAARRVAGPIVTRYRMSIIAAPRSATIARWERSRARSSLAPLPVSQDNSLPILLCVPFPSRSFDMAAERDDLPKHLEFIQAVLERHARTSFVLKGWSVTVVAAVFLLAVRGADSG